MSEELIAEVRAQHAAAGLRGKSGDLCQRCMAPWPCAPIRLADGVERALTMADGSRPYHETLREWLERMIGGTGQ